MAGTCKTVATHTAIVFFFISSLSVRGQSYNNVTRANVGIIDNVRAFHAASHGRVNDNCAYQITDISSFATGSIYAYTHFAKFGQQFVRSVDDCRDHFSRNQEFVTSDSGRNEDVVYGTYTEQVVDIHNQGVLCNTFPDRQVACFFPVHISKG